jgi:hypothetical protein
MINKNEATDRLNKIWKMLLDAENAAQKGDFRESHSHASDAADLLDYLVPALGVAADLQIDQRDHMPEVKQDKRKEPTPPKEQFEFTKHEFLPVPDGGPYAPCALCRRVRGHMIHNGEEAKPEKKGGMGYRGSRRGSTDDAWDAYKEANALKEKYGWGDRDSKKANTAAPEPIGTVCGLCGFPRGPYHVCSKAAPVVTEYAVSYGKEKPEVKRRVIITPPPEPVEKPEPPQPAPIPEGAEVVTLDIDKLTTGILGEDELKQLDLLYGALPQEFRKKVLEAHGAARRPVTIWRMGTEEWRIR